MNRKNLFFFRPLKLGLSNFGSCFLRLALFELVYKALTALLVRPLLSFIFQLLLTLSGQKLAFNEQIFSYLLSVPGILSLLLLAGLSTLLVFFEFAVIISLLRQSRDNGKANLALAVSTAFWSFRCLLHPSTLLFSLYSLVLLPLTNMGIASSLIAKLNIPNFITGELGKSFFGGALLLFFMALLFAIAFLLLFVLPAMICERISFSKACVRSVHTIRRYGRKTLGISAVYALAWMLLFFLPRYLSTSIFGVPTATLFTVFRQFGLSGQTPVALLLWLLFSFASIMLTPFVLSILTAYYVQIWKPVETDPAAITRISSRLYKTGTGSRVFASKLMGLLQTLFLAFWNSRFIRRHRAAVSVLFLLLFALLVYQLFFTVYRIHDPIVIGHRGSAYAVENTLEAIDAAIDCGADFVEIDVQLSREGVPVVVHDTNLRRLTGKNVQVYDLTVHELQLLQLSQSGKVGQIPTLQEVVEYCDGKILLALEFKPHGRETESLVTRTMDILEQSPYQTGCLLFSQDYNLVSELVRDYSDYTIGYCVYGNLGAMSSSQLSQMGIDFLLVEESIVSKSLIRAGQRAFVAIYVWTVNNPANMHKYLDMGVLGLITDYPDEAVSILEARNILGALDGATN